MRIIDKIILSVFVGLLVACGGSSRFPISNVAPAADIYAKKGVDHQRNFTLEISLKNLASANRLNPPGNNYSIWIVTKEFGIKNVGQLKVKNGKKSTFKTVTPFDFEEVFITVEMQGDLDYPAGIEIARTKI